VVSFPKRGEVQNFYYENEFHLFANITYCHIKGFSIEESKDSLKMEINLS